MSNACNEHQLGVSQSLDVVRATLTLDDGTSVPVMVTRGEYMFARQAFYTQWDIDTSPATPAPSAVFPVEIGLTMEVVAINDENAIRAVASKLCGTPVGAARSEIRGTL